jgi:hypothetical protein
MPRAFVEYMELGNFSARGIFDGYGAGRVRRLRATGASRTDCSCSRHAGGQRVVHRRLTYKDLGAMANMAFAALRSLDFQHMRVALDGDLTGEIVTRMRHRRGQPGEGANATSPPAPSPACRSASTSTCARRSTR